MDDLAVLAKLLEEHQIAVLELLKLVREPEPGLSTWHAFVWKRSEEVAASWQAVENFLAGD